MEDDNSIKKNKDVELKEYKILSKYLKKNDDCENVKEIDLPTPESLERLCSLKIVKDNLEFDIKKYKSFIEIIQETNIEKSIFNLDKVESIKNGELIPYILIFLGGINSNTDIYNYFDGPVKVVNEEYFVDNSQNYMDYINSIIDYLKISGRMSVPFAQISLLFKILEELGIKFFKGEKNVFYNNIKDTFFSMEKNKILIIIAPSNNFWVKSKKEVINGENYDMKLNFDNIFYNKEFIHKFLKKITHHPRCTFGLLSSMSYKNLKSCWEGLKTQFKADCPQNDIIFFDQKTHDEIKERNEKKPKFFRNMNKIKEHLKSQKAQNNKEKSKGESENAQIFDEKNILIVESEIDKKVENTEHNSIFVNLFDEKYLEMTDKEKKAYDLEGNKVINYVYDLLEKCIDDIRDYLKRYKLTDDYSKDLTLD